MSKRDDSDKCKKSKGKSISPHIQKLKQSISGFLSESKSTTSVKFGFLEFGPLCNASESNAFTSARCHIKSITNKENKHYSLEFRALFDQGLKLLENYKDENPGLEHTKPEAINKLEKYFYDEGKGLCTDLLYLY